MKLWQHQQHLDFPLQSGQRFAGMAGATTDLEVTIYTAVNPVVVQAVKVAFDAAVTGANTNYSSVVINRYDSTGTLVGAVATYAFTSGKNAVKFAALDLGTIAASYRSLKAGESLTVALVHAGTGIQLPAGIVTMDFRTPKSGE